MAGSRDADDRPVAAPAVVQARTSLDSAQSLADSDQTASDADQTSSDLDHVASERDQEYAESDQALSDRDQASADQAQAEGLDPASAGAYQASREARAQVSLERQATHLFRRRVAEERDETASSRDAMAAQRDESARQRDAVAASLEQAISAVDGSIALRFRDLREAAGRDRAEAARDRARAAADRAEAARERARLEAELMTAHLDDLTGAYRREMGRVALTHEIDRARRGDGRFVLAFVDVDDMKGINDRGGHEAGDQALRAVVGTMRRELRSYDPILRYGGDEFVAGMSGTDVVEAERRFETIRWILAEAARVSITVGLAELADGDTVDELTARADQAMITRRAAQTRAPRHPGSA